MEDTVSKMKQELDTLIKNGKELIKSVGKGGLKFTSEYHKWYTRSLTVVRHLLPDRLVEFERLYHLDNRKDIKESTYTIEDYLQGVRFKDFFEAPDVEAIAKLRFLNQIFILASAASRLDDILANIQGILQATLFDSEIDAARDLKKKGHLRAAGAVVGVVLESHLSKVCQNHGITIPKKNLTISDFNELLKKSDIFDIPTWRWIQRLTDLRNLCSHSKEREPTPEEVQELIDGVDKAIKTIA